MAAVHREVERKYDVPVTFDLPALAGAGPVVAVGDPREIAVHATYYDTAGHRLASARTSLRRRTGGEDEGWHLKLPVSDGARDEVHVPLGSDDGRVPETLAVLARAAARGAGLAPVARLRTARTVYPLVGVAADGTKVILAEVADDRVTAEVFGPAVRLTVWREVEVELTAGAPEVLDRVEQLLQQAGAVPAGSGSKVGRALGTRVRPRRLTARSPAGAVAADRLRRQVAELTAWDPQVRLDQPDAVHAMRVTTRRLRSLLATFRPLYGRAATDPLRDELRWLGGVLGAARDAEVLRDRLVAAAAAEPADLLLGRVTERIDAELRTAYRDRHAGVVEELDSPRYLALLDALDALVESPPAAPLAQRRAADVLPRLVRRSWQRLKKAERDASAVPVDQREPALHQVRKSAKRARYAAEAVAPAFGRPAARFGRRMKELQAHLGELQDSAAARQVLRAMAAGAALHGENGFTYGRLHAREQAKGKAVVAGFAPAWDRASAKSLRRWMR
jgi:CHAD domain-containing protein